LRETLNETDNALRQANQVLAATAAVLEDRRFEVTRVLNQPDGIFILIRESGALQEGDTLALLDETDGVVFGKFEVVRRRGDGYVAQSVGHLDPVWLGSIKAANQADLFPPVRSSAILLHERTAE